MKSNDNIETTNIRLAPYWTNQ